MRKTIYLSSRIVLIVLLVFAGCVRHDYKYIYLQPRVHVFDTVAHNEIPELQALSFNNHLFSVTLPTDEYTASNFFSAFSNKAYATSIPAPTYTAIEKITDIKFMCLKDYNSAFPAGTDIMDSCVFMYNQFMNSDEEIYPMPVYGSGYEYSKQDLLDMLNNNPGHYNVTKRISFRLKTRPSVTSAQQFAVLLIIDNSTRITDTTVSFKFLP